MKYLPENLITMKHILLYLVVLGFCLSGKGQTKFTGVILNSEDESPIPNATIQINEKGTLSNAKGIFSISNPIYPIVLEISHVNYHPKTVIVNSHQESGIKILLVSKDIKIDEIEVVGERLKRFFKDKYYYIIDYYLFDESILTIGYQNRRFTQGQINLMDMNQDTITNLSIAKPKKLFKDGFGNVHLFAEDLVYQIYVQDSMLNLIYPTLAENFSEDLLKLQFQFDNYFVFKKISGRGQANEYYILDTIAKEKIELETIYNEILFSASKAAVRYRPWNPSLSGKVSGDGKAVDAANDEFEAYVYDQFVIHKPINSQIFKYKEGLMIFDHVNQTSFIYNHEFELSEKVKNNFPKHHQRQKKIIQDPVTQKFYWVYYKGSKVLLGEIEIESGQIVDVLETPSLPFIENVQIRNGVIWFLYQPRLGDTTRSLYRMTK